LRHGSLNFSLARYTHASPDVTYDFAIEEDVAEYVLSEHSWVWQVRLP